MSVGPIPWTAIRQYADDMCLVDEGDFDRFNFLIRSMDGVYLNHVGKKHSK